MTNINAVSGGCGAIPSSGSLSGLDSMTAIQLMLMQDYDSQLKDAGDQLKIISKMKKAYRQEIQKYQGLLLKDTVTKGEGNDKKTLVKVSAQEYQDLKKADSFYYDADSQEIKSGKEGLTRLEGERNYKEVKGPDGKKKKVPDGYLIQKEKIETVIEMLKEKKDELNEQSEQLSLQVQSLTNMRKISLETASNCMSKQNDGFSTVARNIKG